MIVVPPDSPRLCDAYLASVSPLPDFVVRPGEVADLVRMGRHLGAVSVAIGSGRDRRSRTAAEQFAESWQAGGGCVVAVVDWPEDAASWLRQATRLTTANPDLWILGGPVVGFAQQIRRLAWSTAWVPRRTLTYSSLAHPTVVKLAGREAVHGLSGVASDGHRWRVMADGIVRSIDASGCR